MYRTFEDKINFYKNKTRTRRANFIFLTDGSMVYDYDRFESVEDAIIDAVKNHGEDLDDMLALGLQGEVLVECCNAVDVGFAHAKPARNICQSILGKIADLPLNVLHYCNHLKLVAIMLIQDTVEHFCVSFHLCLLIK